MFDLKGNSMAIRPILCKTDTHEWDIRVGNGQFIGLLERWNMGDEYQYVYTESTGHQHILEAGDVNEALTEINCHYKGLTVH